MILFSRKVAKFREIHNNFVLREIFKMLFRNHPNCNILGKKFSNI